MPKLLPGGLWPPIQALPLRLSQAGGGGQRPTALTCEYMVTGDGDGQILQVPPCRSLRYRSPKST